MLFLWYTSTLVSGLHTDLTLNPFFVGTLEIIDSGANSGVDAFNEAGSPVGLISESESCRCYFVPFVRNILRHNSPAFRIVQYLFKASYQLFGMLGSFMIGRQIVCKAEQFRTAA